MRGKKSSSAFHKHIATVASQSDFRCVLGRIREASFFFFSRVKVQSENKFAPKFAVARLIVRRVEDDVQHILFEINVTVK